MANASPTIPRVLALAIAGLTLATASALAAFDMVNERRSGLPTLAGPMTPGFALSHRAMSLIATHVQGDDGASLALPKDIAMKARDHSLASLRREPLDGAALRNLALLAQGEGEAESAQELLLMSETVSRRDLRTNVLLAQVFASDADFPATVSRFDQALRTSSNARREILPLLYQALAQPEAQGIVAQMLARNVNWEGDFWAGADSYAPALPQLAQLRIGRAQAGFVSTPRDDRRLLRALVKAKEFASAEALFDSLHSRIETQRGTIRNGDFATTPRVGAFDWELRFDSSLTTDIFPAASQLRIQTYSDGGGLAARQLVALRDAQYRLAVRSSDWDARDANALSIQLNCAEFSASARSVAIGESATSLVITKPAADCVYHWFEIHVAPQEDRRENSLKIDAVSLIPLAGE